jgi:hypothetical protein
MAIGTELSQERYQSQLERSLQALIPASATIDSQDQLQMDFSTFNGSGKTLVCPFVKTNSCER